MGQQMLESNAISAFCDSIAAMLSAGIQLDEALGILKDGSEDQQLKNICAQAHRLVAAGSHFSQALSETGAFPAHVIGSLSAGEESGHLENVLHSLGLYYSEEGRLFSKIQQTVTYPATLLCIMTAVIAFTLAVIMPVFAGVYEGFAGTLTSGSFGFLGLSLGIGWVALVVTALGGIACLVGAALSRSMEGRLRLMKIFEALPFTRRAFAQLALSRFTNAFAAYLSAGINTDTALRNAAELIDHASLRPRLDQAFQAIANPTKPCSLAQALADANVFEPACSRMLTIGATSGNLAETMTSLSNIFFDDAIDRIDATVDNIQPIMAGFMTIAIGATLIAVMLPLIGIMGSLG